MGTAISICGRLQTTEKYADIYNTVEGNYMARFKHESYAYATDHSHQTMKSIYLYSGYSRIAKTNITTTANATYLEIDFASILYVEEWDAASEQMDQIELQIPWLQRDLDKYWKPIARDNCKRIYQKQ